MAHKFINRVKTVCTGTSSGNLPLGAALPGFVFPDTFKITPNTTTDDLTGDSFEYLVTDSEGNWEIGLGYLNNTGGSSRALQRATIYSSSNSDSAVEFSAGDKTFYIIQSAQGIEYPKNKVRFKRGHYVDLMTVDPNTGDSPQSFTVPSTEGNLFRMWIDANSHILPPGDAQDGMELTYFLINTGSYTVTFDSAYKFDAAAPTPKVATGSGDRVTILKILCNGFNYSVQYTTYNATL